MKKTATLIILLGTLVFTSCKKVYNCVCTTTSTLPGYVSSGSETFNDGVERSRSDAKTWCKTNEASATFGTYSTTKTCSID